MKKHKIIFALSLGLVITNLVSCGSGETSQIPEEKLKVEFEHDDGVTQLNYDNYEDKIVGDNYRFSFKLVDGYTLISITANGEPVQPIGNNYYIFTLKSGLNKVKIVTQKLGERTVEKMNVNPLHTMETLYRNGEKPHFPTTGNQKLLVIPVEIKGHEEFATKENKDKIEKAFFANSNEIDFESVSSYYKKSSYGKLNITGEVTDWFKLGQNEAEILAGADSKYQDLGVYEVVNKALEWVKTSQTSINLDEYDNNDDGYIDGIYLVYGAQNALSAPTQYSDLLRNHTFYNMKNIGKGTKENPVPMTYSWSSVDMVDWSGSNLIDSHTYIHEFGHQLGLTDYYDTKLASSGVGTATSPMGGLDMMDYNIGDHSMYSKFALGWTAPYKVTGDNGEVEIKIKPSYSSGDFIIIAGNEYNGLPFDEYIAIEYLKIDDNENNLSYYDATHPFKATALQDGRKIPYYKESGIRVTHIDARSVDNDGQFTDDIHKMARTKFTNTGQTYDGYYDPTNFNSYVITTLVSANLDRNVMGTHFIADNSDLFKEGNSFTFKKGEINSYSNMLPSLTNKLNDGSLLNFTVNIKSISEQEATIVIR